MHEPLSSSKASPESTTPTFAAEIGRQIADLRSALALSTVGILVAIEQLYDRGPEIVVKWAEEELNLPLEKLAEDKGVGQMLKDAPQEFAIESARLEMGTS